MRHTKLSLHVRTKANAVSLKKGDPLSTVNLVRFVARLCVLISMASWMTFCLSRPVLGQEEKQTTDASSTTSTPDTIQRGGKNLINDAYKNSKTAETVEQFTEILDLCKGALHDELSQAHVAYAKKLMAWAHNKRGEEYVDQAVKSANQDDSKQALDFDALALNDFENSIVLDAKRWKAYHNRGVSRALMGKFGPAQADFDQAIKLYGKYANTWFNRGEIHYQNENYDRAIQDYTEAIRIQPDDAGFYSARANALFETQQLPLALSDFDRAVQIDDSNESAYSDRADVLSYLGEWGRAAEDYRRAISLNHEFGRAYQGAAWLMATCPDTRYQDATRALQAAQRAIELDGESDYRYLDTLAAAQAINGNYSAALSLIARAIEIAPETEIRYLERRKLLYERNQPFQQATKPQRGTRR